jgi:hypothetical protein
MLPGDSAAIIGLVIVLMTTARRGLGLEGQCPYTRRSAGRHFCRSRSAAPDRCRDTEIGAASSAGHAKMNGRRDDPIPASTVGLACPNNTTSGAIWRWRDKAHHYRAPAGRKQSPRVRDLLIGLAREVESEADARVVRRDEDPTEPSVPNGSMRLPTRIDIAATPLRDAPRTVRVAQGTFVGQISTVYGQIGLSQPARLPAETRSTGRETFDALPGQT